MRDIIDQNTGVPFRDIPVCAPVTPSFVLKTSRLYISLSEREGGILFEAFSQDTEESVGRSSLHVNQRAFGKIGELTYEIRPAFRGQYYATEMLRSILAYAYGELGLVSLYGLSPKRNMASQYILQRIGFAPNAEIEGFIRYVAWNPRFQTA